VGVTNVMQTGKSGLMAAKTGIATSGHNIANANTEGFNRQRVHVQGEVAEGKNGPKALIGRGVRDVRVERVNDEYVEKQIREGKKNLAFTEERDTALRQVEDIFNEMSGEGLNRVMTKFFNEFRKLSNDPDNEAIRQSVREASQAMVTDFHRIRKEVDDVRKHLDNRIEGYVREMNSLGDELKELNLKIKISSIGGASPNDLMDRRDMVLKDLSSFVDVQAHKDHEGSYVVEIRGGGPFVNGTVASKLHAETSPADEFGKVDGALDIRSESSNSPSITQTISGGKLGALVETRDKTLSAISGRLDEIAYNLAHAVNTIHSQGFTRHGNQGVDFFKAPQSLDRAAEVLELSDEVKSNINFIATAAQADSPGDNRVALAITGLQSLKLLNDGKSTLDDFYNSIVSDVGVASQRNRSAMNQNKDIVMQLGKMREQISGVSIDEETTNLLQFQHTFDASAKVIQIADEMLKTILDLR
jgi:flagellar hook-associated protein 1 FlgK